VYDTLEIDVHHIAFMALAPDLQTLSRPAALKRSEFAWRCAVRQFIKTQAAVHVGGDAEIV
jgi:hypothetical protein